MAYAIQSDLEARLASELLVLLADDNGDGAADTGVIAAMLNGAASELDQALAGRYETPVGSAPEIMLRWCLDLAVEQLFLRRREALPKEHAQAAALTRRAIEAVATGAASLAGAVPKLEALEAHNTRLEDEPVFNSNELELF